MFSFFKICFVDFAITVVPFFSLHFIPLCPAHHLTPAFPHLSSCPWVKREFFGSSISHTILYLPLGRSILYLPFLLLSPCTCPLFSFLPTDNPPCDLNFCDSVPVLVVVLGLVVVGCEFVVILLFIVFIFFFLDKSLYHFI